MTTFYYNSSWPVAAKQQQRRADGQGSGCNFVFVSSLFVLLSRGVGRQRAGRERAREICRTLVAVLSFFWDSFVFLRQRQKFFFRFHVALCMPRRVG